RLGLGTRRVGAAEVAEAHHGAARERLLSARQERRLTIMRHYFDVVLADMEYNRANEHMAIVFVGLDRVRDRYELGQVSDVELAEREATYQQALSDRNRAQLNRRAARNQLAATLNQPGSPPDRVRPPPLPVLEREPPPLDELRQAVRDDNPELLALRREVEARQAAVRAADRSNSPRLDVELAGHVWSENMRSSNDWEAALRLEVPFYQGGARSAARDGARARLREARARLREMEMALDQAVLEAWMELDNLAADRDAADSRRDYREQYLAYSRSLYQMELAADLGDAMVELTAAQKRQAEAAFNIAMTWARIDALQGLMPGPGREGEKP
ncbi:MAG: TolC family protein, partial [Thiohalospira sp.]